MLVDHQLGMHQNRLVEVLTENPPRILVNANQLQQVLLNLTLNAQQAMAGTPGAVRIAAERTDGQVEIRVRDTGPGIPKDIRPRTLRALLHHQTGRPRGPGWGSPSATASSRITTGDILVDSEPGEGTCFILRIPAAQAGQGVAHG